MFSLRSLLLALSCTASSADLQDTVRGAAQPSEVTPTPRLVRLQRVIARNGLHSFYVGRLFIGSPEPQELQVLFDTASGNVLLPHQICKSNACVNHRRYSPWRSLTSADINLDGAPVQPGHRLAKGNVSRDASKLEFTQADLGDGNALAVLVRDRVCMGTDHTDQACATMDVQAAVQLDDHPFADLPSDGIVGLGLGGLVSAANFSIFEQFLKENPTMLPQFGISFGAGAGELYLGGHDSSKFTGQLQWFSVLHPDDGFWEVPIQAVRVGGVTLDACSKGCRGIVDTGATLMGVQNNKFEEVRNALAAAASPGPAGGCAGPELEFDLGSLKLSFRVEDYAGEGCAPQIGPLNLDAPEFNGVYAFGETMLRRYYTAFDWTGRRIGFAPATKRLVRLNDAVRATSKATADGNQFVV
jgi:cathepsin D